MLPALSLRDHKSPSLNEARDQHYSAGCGTQEKLACTEAAWPEPKQCKHARTSRVVARAGAEAVGEE